MGMLFRDLFRYAGIFHTYLGNKIFLVFVLTFLSGVAEGFGMLMLMPLIQTLSSGRADRMQVLSAIS